jgi:NhaA family Na+:H+ antiporter
MALLGNRVPVALRVALLALAVIDDLGAILVIAVFYSSGVAASGLLAAALGIVGVLALQRFGVRSKVAYIVPGAVIWVGIYSAGVHPTIAGVILGLLTPVQAWLGPEGFVEVVRRDLDEVVEATAGEARRRALAQTLDEVDHARREALSPAESLIHKLHGWVAFGIMPIFALANAGVSLSGAALDADAWRVLSAVILGLVVGKPVGVLVAVWLTVRLRIGTLPAGLGFPHILVLGVVAGIGFTMSIFVAQLAFEHPRLLAAAKLGVLVASAVAGVLGLVLGRLFLKTAQPTGAQEDVTP